MKFSTFKNLFKKNKAEVDLPMSDEERAVSKIRFLLNEKINHFEKTYRGAGYSEKDTQFITALNELKDLLKKSERILTKEEFKDALEETVEKLPAKESKLGQAMAYGVGDGSRGIIEEVGEEVDNISTSQYTP